MAVATAARGCHPASMRARAARQIPTNHNTTTTTNNNNIIMMIILLILTTELVLSVATLDPKANAARRQVTTWA